MVGPAIQSAGLGGILGLRKLAQLAIIEEG